ncbi:MAG: aldolase/citrate lyase family protein [Gammaproteobacteria bacterium]|nr:aldolase/citrate lyase family protein [Gammaproteobacteria bacterium]
MLPDALATEAVAGLGFDWVCIDLQHGGIGAGDRGVRPMIRAADLAGVTPVVRVPWKRTRHHRQGAGRWRPGSDRGAHDRGRRGCPVRGGRRRALSPGGSTQLRPHPGRSAGRSGLLCRRRPADRGDPDDRDPGALDQVDAILAVDGVDAVFIGPYDLSVALQLAVENDGEPAFDDALTRVVDACRRAGRGAAILSGGVRGARRVEQGFTMVSVAGDVPGLMAGCRRELETVRKGLAAD